MVYSTNPHLPKVRMKAVLLVRKGWSIRKVARYIGVYPSTVSRWVKGAPRDGRMVIPTLSSRSHHHPHQLSQEIFDAIVKYRLKYKRCSEVIHHLLLKDVYQVSLPSVKRVLRRYQLIQGSPWKRWHKSIPRPLSESPGIKVQEYWYKLIPCILVNQ